MVHKFPSQESSVLCFIWGLLHAIGFNQGWLIAHAELKLPLIYRQASSKQDKRAAKADITVLHVGSYYRLCVVKDKSDETGIRINSEGQLIAEAIAAQQQNYMKQSTTDSTNAAKLAKTDNCKDKGDALESEAQIDGEASSNNDLPIIGIRLNGSKFFFYSIPISSTILYSMDTCQEANVATDVLRFTHEFGQGFDFQVPDDRKTIIECLDKIRYVLAKIGELAKRRNSGILYYATAPPNEQC